MHIVYVRKRLRAALASTGAALTEAAALTGKPLSPAESEFIARPVRGPAIDKLDVIYAEALATIAGHTLDVIRVLASHNPEALERAIATVRDAKIAEAEAPDLSEIVEDLEIAEAASA